MDTRFTLLPAERRQIILSQLESRGAVRVDELSELFEISEMTVRRDLDLLEAEGLLERTHGGAMALHAITAERRYREKDGENREVKAAIAKAAAGRVEDGETVLINSGSTTRQVLLHLAHRPLRIITNNAAAAVDLPDDISAEILLLGGRFRSASGCVVGDWAARLLDELAPTRAILGADGISLRDGVSSPIPEEAALTRLMIERTPGKVTLVADSGKIGRMCAFRICRLQDINEIITDSSMAPGLAEDFERSGVVVVRI